MAYCIHDLDPAACGTCTPRTRPSGSLAAFTAQPAVIPDRDKGPWFIASFDGACSGCGEEIQGGSGEIRADGQGGWEGRCCADDAPGYHGAGELADFDPGTGRSSWDDRGRD